MWSDFTISYYKELCELVGFNGQIWSFATELECNETDISISFQSKHTQTYQLLL